MEIYLEINNKERFFEVEYNYSPERPANRNGEPDSWHPEDCAEIEIESFVQSIDDIEIYGSLTEKELLEIEEKYSEEIETQIWEHLERESKY